MGMIGTMGSMSYGSYVPYAHSRLTLPSFLGLNRNRFQPPPRPRRKTQQALGELHSVKRIVSQQPRAIEIGELGHSGHDGAG